MKYYFCAETLGLYPGGPTGDAVGRPLVEISYETYQELAGHALEVGQDGNPVRKSAEYVPTDEDLRVMVDVERDRRIDAGIEFQGVTFQSRATDRENIAGAAQLAFMAVVAGAQAGDLRWSSADADFTWIASDNTLVPMDAQTVVAFGKAAAERKQALIFAARQLKDMDLIPTDYTDDKWWP